MSKTKRNTPLSERPWKETMDDKKQYLLRKQEEEDGRRRLEDYAREKGWINDDDPPF